MAINRVSFSSESIKENYDITLELVTVRPTESAYLDIPVTPNKMFGYFNNELNKVELFITDAGGRRFIKVG